MTIVVCVAALRAVRVVLEPVRVVWYLHRHWIVVWRARRRRRRSGVSFGASVGVVVVVAEDNLLGLGLGGARTDVPVVVAEVHLLCGGERLPQLVHRHRPAVRVPNVPLLVPTRIKKILGLAPVWRKPIRGYRYRLGSCAQQGYGYNPPHGVPKTRHE